MSVVKLTLVLQQQPCVMCPSQTSTSPAHNGIHENCVCLLFCKDKMNGLSALSPADAMVLRGHCSACSGKTDCSLLEREDAVES